MVARYSITVLVNGVPVPGLDLIRVHDGDISEGMTLSGHAVARLAKDDIISVVFQSDEGGKTYQVDPGGVRLNVKLERRF